MTAVANCRNQPSRSGDSREDLISSYAALFNSLDKDHDGTLSRAEVRTLVDHFIAVEGQSASGHLRAGELARQREQLIADFAREDRDHDAYLTLQDILKEPLAIFDCMHRNHDGHLSPDEVVQGDGAMFFARE